MPRLILMNRVRLSPRRLLALRGRAKRRRIESNGITLLELVIVMSILTLLLLLILPAVTSARKRGNDAVCISRMRQILAAISMYRQDNNQDFPRRLRPIMIYTNSQEVFACPSDPTPEGISGFSVYEGIPKLSYRYFAQFTDIDLFLRLVPAVDANHGILACIVHPNSNLSFRYPMFAPHVRRGNSDGTVLTVRKRFPEPDEILPQYRNNPYSNGCLNGWLLYTNAPCPSEYCQRDECYN